MAFTRSGSFGCTITPPKDPSEYSKILITFAQDGQNLIDLDENDITISGGDIIVELTQEQTSLFAPGKRAWLQGKFYSAPNDVPVTPQWPIDVLPVLNDTILGGE